MRAAGERGGAGWAAAVVPVPERRAAPAGCRSAKFWVAVGAGRSALPLRSGAHPPAQRQKCCFKSSLKKKTNTTTKKTPNELPQDSQKIPAEKKPVGSEVLNRTR